MTIERHDDETDLERGLDQRRALRAIAHRASGCRRHVGGLDRKRAADSVAAGGADRFNVADARPHAAQADKTATYQRQPLELAPRQELFDIRFGNLEGEAVVREVGERCVAGGAGPAYTHVAQAMAACVSRARAADQLAQLLAEARDVGDPARVSAAADGVDERFGQRWRDDDQPHAQPRD